MSSASNETPCEVLSDDADVVSEAANRYRKLQRYIPFIAFLLQTDKVKYIKFKAIKHWIMIEKRFPVHILDQMEKSIKIQYKNMLLDRNIKLPKSIDRIFNLDNVDLCSDEEVVMVDDDDDKVDAHADADDDDDDDDVEIVSVAPAPSGTAVPLATSSDHTNPTKESPTPTPAPKNATATVCPTPKVAAPGITSAVHTHYVHLPSSKQNIYSQEKFGVPGKPTPPEVSKPPNTATSLQCQSSAATNASAPPPLTTHRLGAASGAEKNDDSCRTRDADDEVVSIADSDLLFSRRRDSEKAASQVNKTAELETDIHHAEGQPRATPTTSSAAVAAVGREDCLKNLEKKDIGELNQIYMNLAKKNGIHLENYLKDLLGTVNSGPAKSSSASDEHPAAAPAPAPAVSVAPENSRRPGNYPTTSANRTPSSSHAQVVGDYRTPQATGQPVQYTPPAMPAYRAPPVHCPPSSAPTAAYFKPKLNLNDPRIIKQLQKLHTSPHVSDVVRHIAGNLTNAIHPTRMQSYISGPAPVTKQPVQQVPPSYSTDQSHATATPFRPRNPVGTKLVQQATTTTTEAPRRQTYGEYSRERNRQRLAAERKKTAAAEAARKVRVSAAEIGASEVAKEQATAAPPTAVPVQQTPDTVEKPCDKQSTTASSIDKKTILLSELIPYKNKLEDLILSSRNSSAPQKDVASKPNDESEPETAAADAKSKKQGKPSARGTRTLKGLQCTVKGYEKPLIDPKIDLPKRGSNLSARSAIAVQLKKYDESPKNRKAAATSSGRESQKEQDRGKSSTKRRRSSDVQLLNPRRVLVVRLQRLTEADILKHTAKRKKPQEKHDTNLLPLSVELVEAKCQAPIRKPNQRPAAKQPAMSPVRKRNVDSEMTERNSALCVLCKSKPYDLTFHYIHEHKTESYVARLTLNELEELQFNTPFAEPTAHCSDAVQPNPTTKYQIKCAICGQDLECGTFNDLHDHFATHTGEYAFQCGGCELQKPYESQILSHQHKTKDCHKAPLQVLYQYPADRKVIYLHCCKICHFVQLNEANVFRHLRTHHDERVDDPEKVERLILAAIKDSEPAADPKPTSELPDDGVSVANEPLTEEAVMAMRPELLLAELFNDAEEQAAQYNTKVEVVEHKLEPSDPSHSSAASYNSAAQPMTIVHALCEKEPADASATAASTSFTAPTSDRSVQAVKVEVRDLNENLMGSNEKAVGESAVEMPAPQENVKEENVGAVAAAMPASPDAAALPRHNTARLVFRTYTAAQPYCSLLKCMAADCYFCTDVDAEMLQHLADHSSSECPPEGFLDCAYCLLDVTPCTSSAMLVEHIRTTHCRSRFQCAQCCYRSSLAGNVLVHYKHSHLDAIEAVVKVYSCEDGPIGEPVAPTVNLQHFQQLRCPSCSKSFYSVSCLEDHNLHCHDKESSVAQPYGCVYCPEGFAICDDMQAHLALVHPDELPHACHHNTPHRDDQSDCCLGQCLADLAVATSQEQVLPAPAKLKEELVVDAGVAQGADGAERETKPHAEEIFEWNLKIVKPLLLKLTVNSGVPPDRLYQCPYPSCGGFFSNFKLWSSHMMVTHNCLIVVCPHCSDSSPVEMPLKDFEQHFEKHRRKLYVCFHCGDAFGSEQQIYAHTRKAHPESVDCRLFTIPFNVSCSYFVLVSEKQFDGRLKFILDLQHVLRQRIRENEEEERRKVLEKWLLPSTALWLEDFPSFNITSQCRKQCVSCTYRTFDDDKLLEHMRSTHEIAGKPFQCFMCPYKEHFSTWDIIIQHSKMHSTYLYVCCTCSFYHYDRREMSLHIRHHHDSCDVPLLSLTRTAFGTLVSISVVFSAGRRTFSRFKSCFCCDKPTDTLAHHLKRAHGILLAYSCELCDEKFDKLEACNTHYDNKHMGNVFKVCCSLRTSGQLTVTAVRPFKVQILRTGTTTSKRASPVDCADADAQSSKRPRAVIKQEATSNDDDSDVEMLDADDIIIAEELAKRCDNPEAAPSSIKCIAIKNLLSTETDRPDYTTTPLYTSDSFPTPSPPCSTASMKALESLLSQQQGLPVGQDAMQSQYSVIPPQSSGGLQTRCISGQCGQSGQSGQCATRMPANPQYETIPPALQRAPAERSVPRHTAIATPTAGDLATRDPRRLGSARQGGSNPKHLMTTPQSSGGFEIHFISGQNGQRGGITTQVVPKPAHSTVAPSTQRGSAVRQVPQHPGIPPQISAGLVTRDPRRQLEGIPRPGAAKPQRLSTKPQSSIGLATRLQSGQTGHPGGIGTQITSHPPNATVAPPTQRAAAATRTQQANQQEFASNMQHRLGTQIPVHIPSASARASVLAANIPTRITKGSRTIQMSSIWTPSIHSPLQRPAAPMTNPIPKVMHIPRPTRGDPRQFDAAPRTAAESLPMPNARLNPNYAFNLNYHNRSIPMEQAYHGPHPHPHPQQNAPNIGPPFLHANTDEMYRQRMGPPPPPPPPPSMPHK